MTGTKTSRGTKPRITEKGELVIPQDALGRYRYWQRESAPASRRPFTLWQILSELDAPLKSWKRYAYAENLDPESHSKFCKGAVQRGDGFVFCVDCGRFDSSKLP